MSNATIPKSWNHTEIGALCDLINGRAFKPAEWSDTGLPIIRIQNLNNPNARFNHFNGELANKHLILTGDLLFAWSGTPGTSFGAHVWNGPEAALNQHIFKVAFNEKLISKRYLRYAINQKLNELISGAHGGVGLRHVTKGKFERTEITFPSLPEQKQIAAKLDELLAQVDSIKTRLDAIPTILKRFRQSVLAAAVSGRLTEEWDSKNETYYQKLSDEINADKKLRKIANLSGDEVSLALSLHGETKWHRWKLFPLEQLVDSSRGIPYGIVQTGDYFEKGIPTIRCGDVKPLSLATDRLKLVNPDISRQYSRTLLTGGEVLLAIRGTVGNSAVVPSVLKGCNISREVALIPVRNDVIPKFIAFLLQSPGGYRCLAEKVRGVAQKGINLADIKRFVTPLPPLEEQTQIVHRVKQLFAFAEQIEQRLATARARVDHLTQSILAKAFRGELTAQWRAQNPDLISGEHSAAALLEKIKAARKAAPTKRARKKR